MFNLKEMAKTVLYLQENGLTDFGELTQACDAAIAKYHDFAGRTKANSERMAAITELQKHIGAYVKTREIYAQYRKLPPKKQAKFYDEHTGDIIICQAAKRHFDSVGLKKLPTIQSLKREYAALLAENKRLYPDQKRARTEMMELLTARNNVERILGMTVKEKDRDLRQQER